MYLNDRGLCANVAAYPVAGGTEIVIHDVRTGLCRNVRVRASEGASHEAILAEALNQAANAIAIAPVAS